MAEREDDELVELETDEATENEQTPSPLAEKDKKIDELTEALKRLQAEFENFKKRVAKERMELSKLAAESVVYDMLAVLDTFDQALENGAEAQDAKALLDGLEEIHRQLVQTLQRHGLREIRTDGRFDPFEHEATMREETDDQEDGTILEVFQRGYLLGPKVIRPARVKVSKAIGHPDDHDTQDDESSQQCEER